MKYGRYLMHYLKNDSFVDKENAIANLGDSIQALAMDSIYEQIGIGKEEIRYIKRDFANTYTGELTDVVLYTEFIKDNVAKRLSVSDKIRIKSIVSAVFYNDFSALNEGFSESYDLIKKLQPIGARDEKSLKILKKNGIESYLTGCFTICFPRRTQIPKKKKVFLVDIPKSLEPYIPEEIKKEAEYLSHATQIKKYPVDLAENNRLEEEAKKLLDKYKNEATLVVTGRLHAALPCIAMGIPVIFACDNLDFRFEWVDKFIYPYQFDEYSKIDWNPKALDVEEVKKHFLNYFAKVLKGEDVRNDLQWLNDYYMNRNRVKPYRYFRHILKNVESKYKNNSFKYAIWGAGFHCDYAYELIKEMYPNAEILAVVDKYKSGTYENVQIIKSNQLFDYDIDYLFITTLKGKNDALEWVQKNNPELPYLFIMSQQKS